MTRRDRVQGLAEANAMFDRLPDGAREQLSVELAIIGREVQQGQRALTPVDTGELAGDLALRVFQDSLKLRVGLLLGRRRYGGKRRTGAAGRDTYYGRFVALGREAQTVAVTRRIKSRKLKGSNRRVNGVNVSPRRTIYKYDPTRLRRRGPNAGTPIGSPYKLRVRGMAARDFIRVPGAEELAVGQLAEFWSRLLDRTEGGR